MKFVINHKLTSNFLSQYKAAIKNLLLIRNASQIIFLHHDLSLSLEKCDIDIVSMRLTIPDKQEYKDR